MTQELKKQLHKISQDFYEWLQKMTVDNWREPIEEPIDTFCNYDDESGAELAEIFSKYENDTSTIKEIENYLNQVVEAVNNGTVIENRGGTREESINESYKGSTLWNVKDFQNAFNDFWIKNLELKYGNKEPYYSIAKIAFEAGFNTLFERQKALERDNEVLSLQLRGISYD